jgi:hypothetical protein
MFASAYVGDRDGAKPLPSFRSLLEHPSLTLKPSLWRTALLWDNRLIPMLNEIEYAYSPVRDKVRDLREYL